MAVHVSVLEYKTWNLIRKNTLFLAHTGGMQNKQSSFGIERNVQESKCSEIKSQRGLLSLTWAGNLGTFLDLLGPQFPHLSWNNPSTVVRGVPSGRGNNSLRNAQHFP